MPRARLTRRDHLPNDAPHGIVPPDLEVKFARRALRERRRDEGPGARPELPRLEVAVGRPLTAGACPGAVANLAARPGAHHHQGILFVRETAGNPLAVGRHGRVVAAVRHTSRHRPCHRLSAVDARRLERFAELRLDVAKRGGAPLVQHAHALGEARLIYARILLRNPLRPHVEISAHEALVRGTRPRTSHDVHRVM